MGLSLTEFLEDLRVVDRTPTWQEFIAASPAAKRAIERRWVKIVSERETPEIRAMINRATGAQGFA